MADPKSEISRALEAHKQSFEALHQKIAAMPGCNRERLAQAVQKFKAAHQAFADDAQACVGF